MADTAPTTLKIPRESTMLSILTELTAIKTALTTQNSKLDTQNANIAAWAGALSGLTTGDKTSLVAAINWLLDNLNTHKNSSVLHDIFAMLDEASTADTGAGIHNSLFRGRNLGAEPTAAQYAEIKAGTFKGLWLGDYWSKSITHNYVYAPRNSNGYSIEGDDETRSQTITPVMRILDHDYYRRAGDNIDLSAHHLNVGPDASLFSAPMKQGANSTVGAYALSDMRVKYLAGALNAFIAFFGDTHLLSYRDYLQNAVTDGRATAGAWYDCKVELLDERQAYGGLVFDSGAANGTDVFSRYTVSCKQFNLFRMRPDLISNRQWYWLRNVVSGAWFASVSSYGNCNSYHASPCPGVRPHALIYNQ